MSSRLTSRIRRLRSLIERPLSPVEFLLVGCFCVVLSLLLCLCLGVVLSERWILGFLVVSYGWNRVDFSFEAILYVFCYLRTDEVNLRSGEKDEIKKYLIVDILHKRNESRQV